MTTTFTCARCGDSYIGAETAAKGHSFGQWSVSKEATRREAGEETRSCACGQTESREIPMVDGMNPLFICIIVFLLVALIVVFVILKKKRN